MVSAWQATFEKKIGLFTEHTNVTSPLAAYENCNLYRPDIVIKPHLIWLHLISEMVDTAKYCNRDKVEMLCMLLHRSLPMSQKINHNRDVASVGARFKLLQCGLSLLQGNTIPKSLSRNILRERIYFHALDYFCAEQVCPKQGREELLENILILLKFWQTMRSEKKHIMVTSELSDYDIVTAPQNTLSTKYSIDTVSVAGSDVGRLSNSTGGNVGWYNTIPYSTSTLSKKSSSKNKRPPFVKDSYDQDYMKKRNLILELLAAELEFLITWYNPLAVPDLLISGEEAIMEWRARPVKTNLWRDYTRLAWACNPALAVFLPQRYLYDSKTLFFQSEILISFFFLY